MKDVRQLAEQSAMKLAGVCDECFRRGDVQRGLVALGGALGIAFATELLLNEPKQEPKRITGRKRRAHAR